jgi:DNA-binding MarR family transcriptional regulator
MQEDSQAPLAALNCAVALVERFREQNPAMTSTNMLAFLHVARDEDQGISQSELMKRFDVSDATVSRMVRALTKEGDGRSPGRALVELRTDDRDARRKNIVLTPDGRRLRKKLLEALRELRSRNSAPAWAGSAAFSE